MNVMGEFCSCTVLWCKQCPTAEPLPSTCIQLKRQGGPFKQRVLASTGPYNGIFNKAESYLQALRPVMPPHPPVTRTSC